MDKQRETMLKNQLQKIAFVASDLEGRINGMDGSGIHSGMLHLSSVIAELPTLARLVSQTVKMSAEVDPRSNTERLIESMTGFKVGGICKPTAFSPPELDTPTDATRQYPAAGYEQLFDVFKAAHDQAAVGKGKDRHANGLPFHEQRMQSISSLQNSPDGMAYQVAKKMLEGLEFTDPDRREHELLGALVYLAGIIVWLRNQ